MSDSGRDIILQRVQKALQQVPREQTPIARTYRGTDERDRRAIIAEFIEKVREYKAEVKEIAEADLPEAIAAACRERGINNLLIAPGLPQEWLPGDITLLHDDPPLPYNALDTSEGVLTGCRLGIAQTGTIVLDGGPGQGRRALSLVPDYHLCLIREEQIVGLVPEAIRVLQESREHPITFISGPSATSDIELNRVEGVHGPRTLQVFVIPSADRQ
jgi:L-lactate dehydrogenase complex protein LldG